PFFRPPPLGQPSRGATRRISERPKFAMARAHMPIFSASCGSTRMTMGAAAWTAGRVRSVPEPVMGKSGLVFAMRLASGTGWPGAMGKLIRHARLRGEHLRLGSTLDKEDADGRDKPDHDEVRSVQPAAFST